MPHELRVAHEDSRLHQLLERGAHHVPRPGGRADQLGITILMGLREVEHQAVGLGLAEREPDIGFAHRFALLAEIAPRLGHRGLERVGEAVEGVGADRGQDLVLVAKVPVGRHGATAQRVRELAHADPVAPLGGEAVLRHRAESGPERVDLGGRQILGHMPSLSMDTVHLHCKSVKRDFPGPLTLPRGEVYEADSHPKEGSS